MLAVKSMDVRDNFKSLCNKVFHGETLIISRPKNENVVMLDTITPSDILLEGHMAELTTYKGVMISKSHADKDMFKINLLNMLDK